MQTIAYDTNSTGSVRRGSMGAIWTGRALSGIAVLFLVFDSLGKLLRVPAVIEGTAALGFPTDVIFGLGVTLIACVAAYVLPRTSLLGAVLLTGYLGGAVASQVRIGSPLFTHVLFPTYVAALVWGGLMLRDPRVRAFVPWRRS